MEPSFLLTIVVPVYNSASMLPDLVARISELQVEGGFELVLVNDGSRDESAKVCRQLAEEASIPITFVDLARNFGEHNAVMAGYRHARGEWVVNIDDDFQNPPETILALLEHSREGGFDVVYSRYPERQHAWWRNLGSWMTNRLADWLLDKPEGLYLSSFRCLSSFVVESISSYDGAFPYIDGLVLQVTQRIGVVEVEHAPRRDGASQYTLSKLLQLWSNSFVNFSILPLRLSTGLGILLAFLGFLGTLLVIGERFWFGTPAGWGSLMAALLVFSGVQLIILGITGEYLGRLYMNANRKPQYVVREVHRRE